MITVGSLFSGIGGIELGLERTGKFRTIWQCENDPYASAVLRKHWPDVPNLGDITKVDWGKVGRPDLVCGGFPCQDISYAGRGRGIKEGTRSGLWFEFARCLRSLRPRYALVENVPALVRRGLDIVLRDLAEAGYDAEWFPLRASDLGAPHRRERIFIVAYTTSNGSGCNENGEGDERRECYSERWKRVGGKPHNQTETDLADPNGNAGEGGEQAQRDSAPRIVADDWSQRIQRFRERSLQGESGFSRFKDVRRVEDLQGRPDIPEPLFRGSRDGIPRWVDRIKCLGNAVVPQCAEVIGEAIAELEGLT